MERAVPGKKILVIEDDADSADSLAMLLTMKGYQVAVARSGAEGIEIAFAVKPDVILLDLGMPMLNGYEVASRLRVAGGFEDTLIIALTGHGQTLYRAHSAEAGIDHHLLKPYSMEEIVELVDS